MLEKSFNILVFLAICIHPCLCSFLAAPSPQPPNPTPPSSCDDIGRMGCADLWLLYSPSFAALEMALLGNPWIRQLNKNKNNTFGRMMFLIYFELRFSLQYVGKNDYSRPDYSFPHFFLHHQRRSQATQRRWRRLVLIRIEREEEEKRRRGNKVMPTCLYAHKVEGQGKGKTSQPGMNCVYVQI